MSGDLWYRNADGDGYTNNLDYADPADVEVKHAAVALLESGEAADMAEALLKVRAGHRAGVPPTIEGVPYSEEVAVTAPDGGPFKAVTTDHQAAGESHVRTTVDALTEAGVKVAHAPASMVHRGEDDGEITGLGVSATPDGPVETVSVADAEERWNITFGEDPAQRPPMAETMAAVLADGPPLTITAERYLSPVIRPLAAFPIPDAQAYYPHIAAWLATGQPARDAVAGVLPAGATVAVDIETDGLAADSFVVKCVTAAWETAQGTVAVYLDPLRTAEDRAAVQAITERAGVLILHNAPFDIPPLHQHGLITRDAIAKVHDTAVYARLAYPDRSVGKSLEALSTGPLLGFPKAEMTMAELFKANGLTISEGYREFDGDRPVYRLGAMADTVATLRLLPMIQGAAWDTLTQGHPFGERGVDSDGAVALMEREQRVNRVMMRRSARGLEVDTEYLHQYEDQHAREVTAARDELSGAGLDPDAGNLGFLLVSKLEELGQLPASWPRTPGGKLRATKDDMAKLGDLGHPLATAARRVSELGKVAGYLDKVNEMVRVTGRVHPQVTILGAAATGRMSYSLPELQQFPADARPIIVSPSGLTSVDWSQIEPVIMANCANDWDYLAGFNSGEADLYAPVQAAANVERKVAKVLLLAVMYGRGATSTAAQLGIDKDAAQLLIRSMLDGMPETRDFIAQLRAIASEHQTMVTAAGRILPIPRDPQSGQVMAYKAVNYFCQGSAYDVLADTIVRMEDAGLGGSIHLALHDELVVDTEAAADARRVMEEIPSFLGKWTGGVTPVFRTDSNDMGNAWAYV